jgi:hypothetical protein
MCGRAIGVNEFGVVIEMNKKAACEYAGRFCDGLKMFVRA